MTTAIEGRETLESVRRYYGEILKSKADLQSGSCCAAQAVPAHLREIVAAIHPEVQERFYGCGVPIPFELEGRTVLDLGCGTGRDCFVLSKLAGPQGRVIGVDMTDSQLEVAKRHVDYHAKAFGHRETNVSFVKGYIEDLAGAGLADGSVDVVVSNCVLNLSPDKARVFSEIFRVLKPGGELYFSDVFADRRIPAPLARDPLLLGECLGGALYVEDLRRILLRLGVPDYRIVSRSPIAAFSDVVKAKIGNIGFASITLRAFKLPGLEDRCEDFGQVAYYRGTIPETPHRFVLDDHHDFETNRPLPVCSNTASMLRDSRFGRHFRVEGDASTHYGLFDCRPASTTTDAPSGACC